MIICNSKNLKYLTHSVNSTRINELTEKSALYSANSTCKSKLTEKSAFYSINFHIYPEFSENSPIKMILQAIINLNKYTFIFHIFLTLINA